MSRPERIAVTLMRGGTSKGVFLREEALPPPGPDRDGWLLSLMGSPDPAQIDGLGGGSSSTSKVVAVATSGRDEIDLEYCVYQVGTDRSTVDSRGNCGNLTAAVAPYALDEGLLSVRDGLVDVRLHNLNTDSVIVVQLPVLGGRLVESGDHRLDGVPGTAAAVVTEHCEPAGSVCGRLFPVAGSPLVRLTPRVGDPVDVTIADVTAPVVMVAADHLGVGSTLDPAGVNADPALLERLESIRAAAAVSAGLVVDEDDVLASSPALPRVAILGRAHRHTLPSGQVLDTGDHDLVVRSTSMQRMHHAIPLTTAMCVAATAALEGTVASALGQPEPEKVRLAHPKGVAEVVVRLGSGSAEQSIRSVSVQRTARRLLRGVADVPQRRPVKDMPTWR